MNDVEHQGSTAEIFRAPAPAKVNLFLHVLGQREDGYHEIDSLIGLTSVLDMVEIIPAQQGDVSIDIMGPFGQVESLKFTSDNLMIQAARLLQKEANTRLSAHIMLLKNIPVQAGLGGGSADAAIALQLLNDHWDLGIPEKRLYELALQLGADVPFCLSGRAGYIGGIGEAIMRLKSPLPKVPMVLVNPMIPVPTQAVFRQGFSHYSSKVEHPESFSGVSAFVDYLADQRNDLEHNAMQLFPEIGDVLTELCLTDGCKLARMSGSGATCFALYEEKSHADRARLALLEEHPDWWVQFCSLTG